MLTALEIITERRIAQAVQEGRLDLPHWRGKNLPADTSPMMPGDLKMAYKILKNAGYTPPEIELRKEIQKIEEMLEKTDDEHTRIKQIKKLTVLSIKVESLRGKVMCLDREKEYYRKVVERMSA